MLEDVGGLPVGSKWRGIGDWWFGPVAYDGVARLRGCEAARLKGLHCFGARQVDAKQPQYITVST
jgi:hypothetical protein